MNQKGIGIPHFLMLFSAISITALAFMQSTLSTKRSMVRQLMLLEKQDILNQMEIVFQDPDNCTCQVNPDTNVDDSNDDNLYFNSLIEDGTQFVAINRIQAGCLASSPDIIKVGDKNVGGIQVDSIKLAHLKPSTTAGQWEGEWLIEFINDQNFNVQPIILKQHFVIDPAALAADPTNVFMQACAPNPTTTTTITDVCPSGWSMLGPQGEPGTYCIDTNERAPKTRNQAIAECATLDPISIGPARLCEFRQWYYACRAGALQDATDDYEWTVEYAGSISVGVAIGSGSCENGKDNGNSVNNPIPFRCCYP